MPEIIKLTDNKIRLTLDRSQDIVLNINDESIDLSFIDEKIEVEIKEDNVEIDLSGGRGERGLKGDKGDTGDSGNSITRYAGEIIGGTRVVIIHTDNKIYYADNTNQLHINKVLGVTKTALVEGEEGIIQTFGEMIEPTWNWDLSKPIYLSINGLLTQTVPVAGFLIEIGFPLTATRMMIKLKMPINLT